MKKIISLALLASILSGCTLFRPHQADIVQGNIISDQETRQIHRGMSTDQVKAIMGTPLLVNLFTPDRVNYVYTYQKPYSDRQISRLTCIFRGNRLVDIIRE